MRTAWLSVSVLCVVGAAAPAEAQSAAAGDGGPPAAVQPLVPEGSGAPQAGFSVGRSLRVEPRRVDRPPVVDGRLDEEVWLSAAVVDDFVQQEPAEGDPATERTVVRLLRAIGSSVRPRTGNWWLDGMQDRYDRRTAPRSGRGRPSFGSSAAWERLAEQWLDELAALYQGRTGQRLPSAADNGSLDPADILD